MGKMEFSAEVKLHGLFLKDPERAIVIFEEEFGKFLDEGTSYLMRLVLRGMPVFKGELRGRTFREIRGRGLNMRGIVANPLAKAGFIERGKPPHVPNYANLADWVRIKLGLTGSDLYAVLTVIARNIKARGISPHWMFKNAWDKGKTQLQPMLDKTAERIKERWDQ